MSESSRLIGDVCTRFIAPLMKEAGYRKSGSRTWEFVDAGNVRVLNVQGDKWNSPASARFTLNLGVKYPATDEFLGTQVFGATSGTIETRVGMVVPDFEDLWWTIASGEDIEAPGASVATTIADAGLPWLERMSEPRTAIEFLLTSPSTRSEVRVAMGIAAIELDDRQMAKDIYSDWLAEGADPRPPFQAWVEEHGFGS